MCRTLFVGGVTACCLVAAPAFGQEASFLGKSPAEWSIDLADRNGPPKARRGAAFALGKMGLAGVPGVGDLLDALENDADAGVREACAFALGEIEAAAREDRKTIWKLVGPGLQRVLGDGGQDARVRRSAAFALGNFREHAAGATGPLREAMASPEPGLRQNAARALGRLGKAVGAEQVEGLCRALADADPLVRREAASALGSVGRANARGAAAPLLERFRQDEDGEVRRAALDALVNVVGPKDREAAGPLRELLDDADRDVSLSAALALANIGGEEAAGALGVLRNALGDADAKMRVLSAAGLANLAEGAAPAVPELARALTDRDPDVRRHAALALSRVGRAAANAVDQLAGALASSEPREVRAFAAEALSRMGASVEKAVPELLRTVKEDPDAEVRHRSVWALVQVSDLNRFPTAEPLLVAVLDEKDRAANLVRYNAALGLAMHLRDRSPEKAVDVLLEMLKDTDVRVYKGTGAEISGGGEARSGAARTEANLGGEARYMAARALELIGPRARRDDVIKALEDAARSSDSRTAEAASSALRRLGS